MRDKIKKREYKEKELAQQTENEIRLYQEKLKKEKNKLKNLIVKLIRKYDDYDEKRSLKSVMDDAGVSYNVFRRINYKKDNYSGPDKMGCIRIALAIGCDNFYDIDSILLARGFEPLSNAISDEDKYIRNIVKIILAQEELPLIDRATVFAKRVG